MAETASTGKKAPKGGRRGGTLFPRIALKQALDYAKKLVSKTHTGPQPETTILPGVFGSAGPPGKVRASALKQFGLLEGTRDAYQATELAREIDGAPPEDRPPLLQRAFRSSRLFNRVFETFHADTVSKAKIDQRVRVLGVHPDSADECAQLFIDSAVTAGLGKADGESVSLVAASAAAAATTEAGGGASAEEPGTLQGPGEQAPAEMAPSGAGVPPPTADEKASAAQLAGQPLGANKGAVTVNLTVDSSSDPDKLEKQLRLLKQYGLL